VGNDAVGLRRAAAVVNRTARAGLLVLAVLAPAAAIGAPAPRFAGDFDLNGRKGALTYLVVDEPDQAARHPHLTVRRDVATWVAGDGEGRIAVILVRKACDNGMSDKIYPYEATVKLGVQPGRGLSGCGEPARRRHRRG
jgi:hypothetical protein